MDACNGMVYERIARSFRWRGYNGGSKKGHVVKMLRKIRMSKVKAGATSSVFVHFCAEGTGRGEELDRTAWIRVG